MEGGDLFFERGGRRHVGVIEGWFWDGGRVLFLRGVGVEKFTGIVCFFPQEEVNYKVLVKVHDHGITVNIMCGVQFPTLLLKTSRGRFASRLNLNGLLLF